MQSNTSYLKALEDPPPCTHSHPQILRLADAKEYGELIPAVCGAGDIWDSRPEILHGSAANKEGLSLDREADYQIWEICLPPLDYDPVCSPLPSPEPIQAPDCHTPESTSPTINITTTMVKLPPDGWCGLWVMFLLPFYNKICEHIINWIEKKVGITKPTTTTTTTPPTHATSTSFLTSTASAASVASGPPPGPNVNEPLLQLQRENENLRRLLDVAREEKAEQERRHQGVVALFKFVGSRLISEIKSLRKELCALLFD